jgi:hypothetical protein
MLLDAPMRALEKELRAFLDDPRRNVFFLRSHADLELLSARVLAKWTDGAEEPEELSFPVSGTFETAAAFYREGEQTLSEVLSPLAERFAEDGVELSLPRGVAWDRERPACSPEVLFAEYLEGVQRALSSWFRKTIFVFRFDAVLDREAAAASLAALSGAVVHPGVKIVVLDDLVAPVFASVRGLRHRYEVGEYRALLSDLPRFVGGFLDDATARVRVVAASRSSAAQLADALTPLERPLGYRVVRIKAELHERMQFCNDLFLSLKHHTTQLTDALPDSLYDLRAIEEPEASLTAAVEALLPDLCPGGEMLFVAARPRTVHDVAEWERFCHALSESAVSTRVRYLLFAIDDVPVPRKPSERVESIVHELVLDTAALEEGAARSLADPASPLEVKFGAATLLGNFAVAHGDFEKGVRLLAEALRLSEESAKPETQVSAWWSLGNALQRAERYDLARNAYSESVSLALDGDNDVSAGHGIMGVGHTLFLEGNYREAVQTYNVARRTWANRGLVFFECQALTWMGEACAQFGDLGQAEKYFRSAYGRYQNLGEPFADGARAGMAEVLERLGGAYARGGRDADAEACRAQARALGSAGPFSSRPS